MKAIITLLLILLINGNSLYSTEYKSLFETRKNIGYIDVNDIKLNDLYLKMPYSEVVSIMGKESKRTKPRDLGEDVEYDLIYQDGTVINIINEKVYSIEVTSERYQTPKGLRVGDTKEKVIELYNYPSYQDENDWNYTTDNDYNLFTILFEGNKVSKIIINLAF